MREIELLIAGGTVITVDSNNSVIEDGAVAIDQGIIIETGERSVLERTYRPAETRRARGGIVMPGLINAHTHVAMSYFRGLADDLPLMRWLQDYIWPAEAKHLNPQFVYDASLHGIAEMLKGGITCFSDMYFLCGETARAAHELGIRAQLGWAIVDFPVAGQKNAREILDKALRDSAPWKDDPRVDFTIAPHSIYTCSTETLTMSKEVAEANDMRMHIHLSETRHEVDECLARHKKRPARYLKELDYFSPRLTAAHGVWLDPDEQQLLAEAGTGMAICTESNLKLASGFAPIAGYLEKGVHLGFGTDGVASNNNLSLFEEMSTTTKVHKALNEDPTFLAATDTIRMATMGAARVIGLDKIIGSLEPGKQADVIILDTSEIDSTPFYHPASHVVYTLNTSHVRDVFIAGESVVENRVLTRLSEEEIIRNANRYSRILLREFEGPDSK